jgi:hypothetical protein
MAVQYLEGLGSKGLILSKINPGGFKKEHPPLVIVGDVNLIRGDVLEVGKVVVVLKDLFEFGLDDREAVFEFLCDRDEVGIKVFLISEQGVLMEVLLE